VLAVRSRRRVLWNSAEMKAQPGLAGADEIINGSYRRGWEVV